VHNLIALQLINEAESKKTNWINQRSFKNIDPEKFNEDLQANLLNTVSVAYTNFSKTFMEVTDKHAPLNCKKRPMDQSKLYMNETLKQSIYKKRMSQNTCYRYKIFF
jgi:hypothetical protein